MTTTATHISDVVPNVAPLIGAPVCPKCGGRMWDNRASKRNPKAPDFKCRDRRCDGVLWPGQHNSAAPIVTQRGVAAALESPDSSESSNGTKRHSVRRCYLAVTEFVLNEVRPKYQDAGVPCSDATVAAIVATIFIQTCRQGREGI